MKRRIAPYVFLLLTCASIGIAQECPTISYPANGDTDIPVDATIKWTPVDNIIGYVLSLGTTPGGVDILNRRSAGLNNEFTPPTGLPESTTVYVTIEMFIWGQPMKVCDYEVFTTKDVTTPPPCTSLSQEPPRIQQNAIEIRWNYASTATGYFLSYGVNASGDDMVADLDVGNILTYSIRESIPDNADLYIKIVPYNENGAATGCQPQALVLAEEVDIDLCASYHDSSQGGVVHPSPQLTMPDLLYVCQPALADHKAQDHADGYRWIHISDTGEEELVATGAFVLFERPGRYRLEAFNNISTSTGTIECTSFKEFFVYHITPPVFNDLRIHGDFDDRSAEIMASGPGELQYALDDPYGEYQLSPNFSHLDSEAHTVYVRNPNGCEILEVPIPRSVNTRDFPAFFTPNGDNVNEYWQFAPIDAQTSTMVPEQIYIYDRYGNLLMRLDPRSKGWNGEFNGSAMPASDYWYVAYMENGRTIKGHFALKR